MSFILDAIAKSERERQQQEIPDTRTLATPVSELRRPRRLLPYLLLVAALLLNVIVVLIWIQTDESPFNELSQTENNNIEPVADRIAIPNNVVSENAAPKEGNANSSAIFNQTDKPDRVNAQSAGSKPEIPKPLKEAEDEIPHRMEGSQTGSTESLESVLTQKVTENSHGSGQGNRPIAVESNTQSPAINRADEQTPAEVQNAMQPAPRKVFRLSELPADVRRDLPSISFTGHLFSKNVKVSYVMVDGGRSVIAGQQIAEDLFLHEVTPAGAVVDFRGYLVEVGILQNWSLK